MIKLFNLNSFAEAMLYYKEKANDDCVEKRLAKLIKQNPEHRDALEKAARPAIALEKLLDEKLKVDNTLVKKYFKIFDDNVPSSPFGFCLAFIMAFFPLMDNLDRSVSEMCEHLRKLSSEEQIYSVCFGLTEPGDELKKSESIAKQFLKRLENSQLAREVKWEILNAAFDYSPHMEELLSLIIPASELIHSYCATHNDFSEEFHNIYLSSEARMLFETYFNHKLEPSNITRVVPMLLGFDFKCRLYGQNAENDCSEMQRDNSHSLCNMFIGIGCHLISRSPHAQISSLTDKMKALSDSTRLEMLFYLCSHRVYGQELCNKFVLGQSAVSYHVTKLLTAGFVTAELDGGRTYYTADKAGIQRMLDAFAEKIK